MSTNRLVFVGPVRAVRLGVDVQDVVEVSALGGRIHVAVQNGRSPDLSSVES